MNNTNLVYELWRPIDAAQISAVLLGLPIPPILMLSWRWREDVNALIVCLSLVAALCIAIAGEVSGLATWRSTPNQDAFEFADWSSLEASYGGTKMQADNLVRMLKENHARFGVNPSDDVVRKVFSEAKGMTDVDRLVYRDLFWFFYVEKMRRCNDLEDVIMLVSDDVASRVDDARYDVNDGIEERWFNRALSSSEKDYVVVQALRSLGFAAFLNSRGLVDIAI